MHARSLVVALAGALLLLPAQGQAQQNSAPDRRPGIAVFRFASGGSYGRDKEDLTPLEVGVQQMLMTELAQNSALRIVDRAELRQIMAEQNLAASGRVDPATAARVGKLVGARYAVLGSFTDLFGSMRLDGRVVDVETGEVLNAQEVQDKREDLYPMLVKLAAKITSGVKLPPLPATLQESRSSRAIPAEAVQLYSRAQVYQDGGHTDKAIELYRMIVQKFPQMTEATEALHQLSAN